MKKILVLSMIFLTSASCKNAFSEFATTDSDEAVFYNAQMANDNRDYTAAILAVSQLSASYQAKREVQLFLASAYAGRCGLDFLTLAEAMTHISAPSNTLMDVVLANLKPASSYADCKTAESIMYALSSNGTMANEDEALEMAVINLAKIGAILAIDADTNNDGVPDPGFTACNTVATPDADARQIGIGLDMAQANLAMTSAFSGALSSFSAICAGFGSGFCAITDPAAFTNGQVKKIRGFVNYQNFGVGTDAAYTPCP